ncbi:MAG: hypothetical protein Kow0068_08520 [Marinilabiliales bacterium]
MSFLKISLFVLCVFFSINIDAENSIFLKDTTENVFGEFKDFNEDSLSNDEFGEFKDFNDSVTTDDEFGEFSDFSEDEFSEFSDTCAAHCTQQCQQTSAKTQAENNRFYWILTVLIATFIAGILVRFKQTRNLRAFFLVASLLVIGFYKTACTACPVVSFQNLILEFTGIIGIHDISISWKNWYLIPALIPITYLFGRVYCGWICHLGALQEILYRPNFKFLQKPKNQLILKIIRYILLTTLLIQLFIMGSIYWCRIDPFINIFGISGFLQYLIELQKFDFEMYIVIALIIILIISSIISFRPFCRTACPVGLILGLVTKIPGASVIGIKAKCIGCKLCDASCDVQAITRQEKYSIIRNSDCIACGNCIDACGQEGLGFFMKSKKHKNIVYCSDFCEKK